jgi:protein-S-isoprenylcysteine O-methyltransferase Ste14
VILFPLLLLGGVLEYLFDASLFLPRSVGIIGGSVLFLFGFWLINRSKRELDQADQPSLPGEPTTRLVTSGPFQWSRNPNYLGACLAGLGGAIVFDSPWLIACTILAATILNWWMIRPEERYLTRVFGRDYETYRSRVRRWF